ncbi:uncharacterized protein [Gossypium hirsutum]|uniref:Uncharacterized protein n=1 Tax=Gossypium hirsutum TaxID=3635 RepID=A0ABM3AJY8_GOSHI|nr:uncharacterized protein LOC121220071 [Gossypium hirsutum]
MAPPPMNTMEQLLAVQNAISQAEQLVQDGNIVLLKFRALLLSILPQARDRFATLLVFTALVLALVPSKYMLLVVFLETFTRYSLRGSIHHMVFYIKVSTVPRQQFPTQADVAPSLRLFFQASVSSTHAPRTSRYNDENFQERTRKTFNTFM